MLKFTATTISTDAAEEKTTNIAFTSRVMRSFHRENKEKVYKILL